MTRVRVRHSLTAAILAIAASLSPVSAARAQTGSAPADLTGEPASRRAPVLTMRRALGVAFLTGSAVLTSKGFDYRDQADEFYDAYRAADDPVEIDRFYQRTANRDVKSQVSWALAAACGVTGLRLLFTGDDDYRAAVTRGPAAGAAPKTFRLVPAVTPKVAGLYLQRCFL